MTTIRTTGRISDTVQLVNCHGEEMRFSFDFLPSSVMLRQIREIQIEIAQAKGKPAEEKAEQIGQSVLALFRMIFGAENTERIVAFYDGQFDFMAMDFLPYLTETILPQCRAAAKSAQKASRFRMRK